MKGQIALHNTLNNKELSCDLIPTYSFGFNGKKYEHEKLYPVIARVDTTGNYMIDLGANCCIWLDREYLSKFVEEISKLEDMGIILKLSQGEK